MSAVVTGVGSAVPERMDQAGLWDDFFRAHYAGDRVAERIFASSAITMRHGVADPRVVDVSVMEHRPADGALRRRGAAAGQVSARQRAGCRRPGPG